MSFNMVKKGARKGKCQWSQLISSNAQATAGTHRSPDISLAAEHQKGGKFVFGRNNIRSFNQQQIG